MKSLRLDWNKTKVDAMIRARGPIKGVAAVLVSEKLGDEYATVAIGKNASSILATLPSTVGIYAEIPTSHPEEISSRMLSLWSDDSLKASPYSVESDGVVFHKVTPDHLLCDVRTFAWEMYAEQYQIEIVEAWGTAAATA